MPVNGKKNGRAYEPPKYRTIKYKSKDDRDPAMGDIYAIAQNEGLNDEQLHVMSGVSRSTLNNWWGPKAKTRRPTHICLAAVLGAMGWEYVPQRRRAIDVNKEMAAGVRWQEQRKREKEREK